MNRHRRLTADPDKTRAWQRRSRKALPAESARRIRERPLRRRIVADARERDGGCVGQARVPGHRCWGPLVGHEITPRSLRPGGHLVLDNVVTVCWALNSWIADHQPEAERYGLHAGTRP